MTGIDLDRFLASYDYELPADLIAQTPVFPRDSSRLLVVNSLNNHTHDVFRNLPDLLLPKDLLILNNTRVIPARLYGRKTTGALVQVLLVEELQNNCWLALVKPGRRIQPGMTVSFELPKAAILDSIPTVLKATVLGKDEATGGRILQFEVPAGVSFTQLLEQFGQVPLPPYITASQSQPEQYQTVYAERLGAVAAPTAGLHFTDELLNRLQQRGIGQAYVTLHVGIGTFRQVEVEDITSHKMHGEWVEVPESTVEQIRQTKANGGRIIAVGTTAVRALEACAAGGELKPYSGKTELFIYPGYKWRLVEGLITNFHLPRSSLLMLVSALLGRQRLMELYQEAIAHRYRFYSFGDAMLILPQAKIANT
ncbi:MAG: tRNA preQ1(34) S-adenosylmethionine ribosyltransferase-isomerase QueA [Aphanothece sp. CMT-3BRIN-NPC111]|nr:tRNA preQ1(34) S-adenosylmethionine ribosyltransferase-isomerase QueA [Aphanothece sp. CMT-3BRIN-NPC111]